MFLPFCSLWDNAQIGSSWADSFQHSSFSNRIHRMGVSLLTTKLPWGRGKGTSGLVSGPIFDLSVKSLTAHFNRLHGFTRREEVPFDSSWPDRSQLSNSLTTTHRRF